jgi:bifunctional DNA-binding transcriptional regulator/antitoxin component of YhaV-PrlF toxin-antitoxin module
MDYSNPEQEFNMQVFEEVRTVTSTGRVVVPWVIQRALGLDHGGQVVFKVENGAVTLISAEALKAQADAAMNSETTQPADTKHALMMELRALLDASDRDRLAEAFGL